MQGSLIILQINDTNPKKLLVIVVALPIFKSQTVAIKKIKFTLITQ
jgi:hypothetical protein